MITTTNSKQSTKKKTFSIQKDFIKKLENEKNKSKVVNKALDLYYKRKTFLEKADNEFIENIGFDFFTDEQLLSLSSKGKNDYDKISALID